MAKDARDAIIRVFTAAGYKPHQIAGVLGHAERESGFDVNASGDNGASRGLFQWQGPRLKALKAFAAEQGGKANDPEIQAQFAVNELSGSEKGAGRALQSANDPQQASIAMNRFERFSHNGGWKNAQGGESVARQQAAMRNAKDVNTNVAEAPKQSSPFDKPAQDVADYMQNTAPGKKLQADYVNKTAPAPLEKEIAQAVAQNDQVAALVPKGPGNKVSSTANGRLAVDDGDYHQAIDDVTHPTKNGNGNMYVPGKNAPQEEPSFEEPAGNPLVQQTSMRVPRAEGQPRWKARAAERGTRNTAPPNDVDTKLDPAKQDAHDATRAADDGMPEPTPRPKAQKPTTEDDIIRQVLREEQLGNEVSKATGLDPNGQIVTGKELVPVPNEQAFNPTSVSKVAAPLAGGAVPLAIAASDQGDQRGPVPGVQGFHDDPALKAVEDKVGAKPAAQEQPSWLKTALGDLGDTLIPSVMGAVQENPAMAPAADNMAKAVVSQMAKRAVVEGSGGPQSNDGGYYQRMASQAGYSGDSQEMLRAVQMDQSGQQPPMQPQQTIPLPQPRPQDAPIDVSSYMNGGGLDVG